MSEGHTELKPNLSLCSFWEISWLLISEEVKICFILLELLPNDIKFISQLIILFGNLEEIIPADRLNHANSPRLEFLQKLCIIAHKTICAEAGALKNGIKQFKI